MVPFSMTLSDLEWLSEIFNDTKHRAASLRQLSFLLAEQWHCMWLAVWILSFYFETGNFVAETRAKLICSCAEMYFIFVIFLCGTSLGSSIIVMYIHNRSAANEFSSAMPTWVRQSVTRLRSECFIITQCRMIYWNMQGAPKIQYDLLPTV